MKEKERSEFGNPFQQDHSWKHLAEHLCMIWDDD